LSQLLSLSIEALAVSSGFVASLLWFRVALTKRVNGNPQLEPVVAARRAMDALFSYAAGATALSIFASQVIQPFVR
jgi:hypothetical protein